MKENIYRREFSSQELNGINFPNFNFHVIQRVKGFDVITEFNEVNTYLETCWFKPKFSLLCTCSSNSWKHPATHSNEPALILQLGYHQPAMHFYANYRR